VDSDTKGLLHEDFDYMIDELRENGEIKDVPFVEEEKDNLVNIVGNVIGEVEVLDRETRDGKPFTVVNFAVASKDKDGNSIITNCSAYGNKAEIPMEFQKGDFVKLFGEVRTSIDNKGKEHSNVRILSSKILKTREQMKNNEKGSGNLEKEIQTLKHTIEERKKDLYYSDSFEQFTQGREDIEHMEKKLFVLEQKLNKEAIKSNDKASVKNEKEKPKKSVLGAIQKFKAEDKAKSTEAKKTDKQSER